MADVIEFGDGTTHFRIEGLGKTMRALSQAGADAEDMRDAMFRLGGIVVQAARPRAPFETGRLSSTIRAGRGKTKAVVRAGGARTPYAGVIHYGWPARNIEPQPFLVDALNATRGRIFDALDDELSALLKKSNLK